MWKSCFSPLLLFLPLRLVASECLQSPAADEKRTTTCDESRVCYTRTLRLPGATVQKSGCLEGKEEEKETFDCGRHLHGNGSNEICLQSKAHEVCCCLADSSSGRCNVVWQLATSPPAVTPSEALLLLLSAAVSVALPFALRHLPGNRLLLAADSMRISIRRFEGLTYSFKTLTLLIFLAVSWLPAEPSCHSHPEGLVQPRPEFLFQAASLFGSWPFVLPLACLLSDSFRLYRVEKDGIPTRQFVSMGLVSIGIGLSCSAGIAWNCHLLKTMEETETTLCRRKTAGLQLIAASCLLLIYGILGVVQQIGAWRQRRSNNYRLLEEEQEARARERDVLLDELPRNSGMETAVSERSSPEEELIDFNPRPFALDSDGEGVLTIRNLHLSQWVAIRLLCSIPRNYAIHPQKLVLPPQREVTVSVRTLLHRGPTPEDSGKPTLMIQWFSVDSSAPPMDAMRLWQKPFVRPRHHWKFFVLPIFHEQ